MVCYDGEAAAGLEHRQGVEQQPLQRVQLVVGLDAQSLECLCQVFLQVPGVEGRSQGVGQLRRGQDGGDGARLHYGVDKNARPFQVGVRAEYALQFFGRSFRNDPGGSPLPLLIHAHVKRSVLAERETALAAVEVMERYAQVGKNAVHFVAPVIVKEIGDEPVVGVYKCKPGIVGSVLQGVDVAVETEKVSRGAESLENGARMTAAAKCGIYITATSIDV